MVFLLSDYITYCDSIHSNSFEGWQISDIGQTAVPGIEHSLWGSVNPVTLDILAFVHEGKKYNEHLPLYPFHQHMIWIFNSKLTDSAPGTSHPIVRL